MNCKVCGSAEFVTNDGITYCTECQIQIEETQTEVAVEHTLSRDIRSSRPKKKTLTTQKEKIYKDWISAECFNHILYMQVSSLIRLGASQKLRNTVLHIWSKYLQKCEIVFRIDYKAKDGIPLLGTGYYKRDLQVLYGNKQISKRKRKKKDDSDTEFSENTSADEGVSNFQVDDSNPESDNASSSEALSSEDKCDKPIFSTFARKALRKKKVSTKEAIKKWVFSMTLPKTLSICYLGMMYTEDTLSLSDLIRFVYEEKIPYLNLLDKLPPTLKLQMNDQATFLTYHVPDALSILKTSREIGTFLKLPDYKEPSVNLAAARLVKDLNLPDDILPIITCLNERYKEEISHFASARKIETIPPEFQALASILVAMKMLFVLDDKFEIEHSKVMNKLNALHPDRRYFVWTEWKEHSMVKEFLFLSEKPCYSAMNNLDSLSANLIISKYPFTRLRPISEDVPHNPRDVVPVKHKINEVLSNIVHIPSRNPSAPTSFPLRRAVKCFMQEWRTLPMFKETKEIDFTLLNKDFSLCSLSFNPLQFDKVGDELSHLLMTSLYLPDTLVKLGSKYYHPVTYHHDVICTTSSYWFYIGCGSDWGTVAIKLELLDKLPRGFKWLLNFFSKYVYCNSTVLYKEVVQMEKMLFFQKLNLKRNAKIKNKINVNF